MTEISGEGYQWLQIQEGTAPYLIGTGVDIANAELQLADISTIKATITNITSGEVILDEVSLTKSEVWSDDVRAITDADGVEIEYNLGWQTLPSYFATPTYGSDAQFKVEVWVTPVLGQKLSAWWLVTAKRSIVPIPEE